jgi:hypothetical protein
MGHMVKSLAVGLGFFRILAEAPHFHNAQQHRQADFVDGLSEIRYIQRFDNIVGTAKFPATVDGFLVVGGRQHDHRNSPQFGIGLDLAENLDVVNLGHPDIQQQKVGLVRLAVGAVTLLEQVIQCLLDQGSGSFLNSLEANELKAVAGLKRMMENVEPGEKELGK